MAFVQFTQPDDQPIVINTERIITAAPAPPDGQGTRITFTNGGHQDVKELIADLRVGHGQLPLSGWSLAHAQAIAQAQAQRGLYVV